MRRCPSSQSTNQLQGYSIPHASCSQPTIHKALRTLLGAKALAGRQEADAAGQDLGGQGLAFCRRKERQQALGQGPQGGQLPRNKTRKLLNEESNR